MPATCWPAPIAPVVGYDQAAVCVLDGDSTIVVMVDADGRRTADGHQAVVRRARSSGPLADRAVRPQLLATRRRRDRRRRQTTWTRCQPALTALPVPVISQVGAELALARGAALVSAQSTEFTDAEMLETVTAGGRITKPPETALLCRSGDDAGRRSGDVRGVAVAGAGPALGAPPRTRSGPAGGPLVPRAHPIAEAPAPPPAAVRDAGRPPGTPSPRPEQAPVVQHSPSSRRRRSTSPQPRRFAARAATSGGASAAARAAQPAPAAHQAARTPARPGS